MPCLYFSCLSRLSWFIAPVRTKNVATCNDFFVTKAPGSAALIRGDLHRAYMWVFSDLGDGRATDETPGCAFPTDESSLALSLSAPIGGDRSNMFLMLGSLYPISTRQPCFIKR